MKAVIYQGPRKLAVDEVPEPELEAPTDAIVRITHVAICGSDLHIYHGDMPQRPGAVVGHEFVGVVESVGDGVQSVTPGDHVVGAFHIACGTCPPCRLGRFHHCRRGGVLGYGPAMGDLPGVQAELGRIPFADTNLRRIPEGVDPRRALFCGDNLTTVWGALKNVGFRPGESLAIIGCGPIGLQAILAADVMQAGQIVAIDLLPNRLSQAEAFGATVIDGTNEDVVKRGRELTAKAGFDVILEAVGGPKPLETAFNLVGPGSRVTAVGVSNQPVFNYPLLKGLTWDITFRIGLANIHRDWDETLRLVERGLIDPSRVVSNEMPLDEAVEAYELFDRREATKIILRP